MSALKDHISDFLHKCESVGLLPRGKAADLIENYDTVQSDERPTIPETEPVPDVDYEALDEQTKTRARKV